MTSAMRGLAASAVCIKATKAAPAKAALKSFRIRKPFPLLWMLRPGLGAVSDEIEAKWRSACGGPRSDLRRPRPFAEPGAGALIAGLRLDESADIAEHH